MSNTNSKNLPLWVQDREKVISNDIGVEWRGGKRPDYSHNDRVFEQESKYHHPEGSLEAIAHNLVRTFEMEASNKTNPEQWLSVVADKFRMSSNGGKEYTAEEAGEHGTYNLFISKNKHYNPEEETFESSFKTFNKAFPKGFLWEVIEVLSGPPNVTFKWRHWGTFQGNFKDYQPTGETIEIIGMSIARLTEDLKILSVEHYFDNSKFIKNLTAGGCPFHSQK
ncbi:ester cyclase [Okeania sp. KiyG1]|uniref:ester cyclase n=1 Tax=Okeania sp. KiyG1 TaxID=2720165 RepID=UPI001924F2D9|nr:ester cyclase [Okeania sp. KiyG1]